jgi:hypothetical protein
MYVYFKVKSEHSIGNLHYLSAGLTEQLTMAKETYTDREGKFHSRTVEKMVPPVPDKVFMLTDMQYDRFIKGDIVHINDDFDIRRDNTDFPLIDNLMEIVTNKPLSDWQFGSKLL